MILPASEYKIKMDAKRAILNAVAGAENPELALQLLRGILDAADDELDRALKRGLTAPTSVVVRVDPEILGQPGLPQLRSLFINLGYTVTPNIPGGQVTISW